MTLLQNINTMRKFSYAVAIFMLLYVTNCKTSMITNTWKSNDMVVKKYNKIMVVALVKNKDHDMREKMENHLTNDLNSKGENAVSSYQILGPKSFEGMKENQVIDNIRKLGADAVLTIVLLDKEKEKYYVPGRIYYSPYIIYHRRFWGYYTTIYDRIYEPGYYSEKTDYFWESNFYDLESRNLIYSVQTKSFNPESVETLAHEYGKVICDDMIEKGLLK